MRIRSWRRNATARRALNKPLLDQIRLIDVFERLRIFTRRRRQRIRPDGSAVEFLDYRPQYPMIHPIETERIDPQKL